VQTTLLGLAIALILALVAALVGPQFVDWSEYRARFEAEATRIVGEPVRIDGAIDVRILPVPLILLRDVEAGPSDVPTFKARGLRIELALASLMRGEWRAALVRIDAPQVALGLDLTGKFQTPLTAPGFDPENFMIDRIEVTDGKLTLADASTGSRSQFDRIAFGGEVRSLAGPVRGEGTFALGGHPYSYRVSAGRRTEAGVRVKLNVDPSDRALTMEADGNLTVGQSAPKFEGTLTVARPAGAVLASGRAVASDPWRITSQVKADPGGALFEQVELQHGPEERSIRLSGTGNMKFGGTPRLDGILSARQVDLDRTLAAADASRTPLAALRDLPEAFGGFWRAPLVLTFGIGIDSVTLGGATVQNVRGDIAAGDGTWNIESFEFRAPGFTQVRLSGRIDGDPSAAEFSGPVSVQSSDPKALVTWLTGSDRVQTSIGPLQVRGDVKLGRERFSVDRVKAEFDGRSLEGRLGYAYAAEGRPARLDAALKAAEFDLDSAVAFGKSVLGGSGFDRPGEIALAVDVGRTVFGGIEARSVTAGVRFDASGLRVENLAIADFGGAAFRASGQIDTSSMPPNCSGAMPRAFRPPNSTPRSRSSLGPRVPPDRSRSAGWSSTDASEACGLPCRPTAAATLERSRRRRSMSAGG
jgi:large subunit ribosomal protein L24